MGREYVYYTQSVNDKNLCRKYTFYIKITVNQIETKVHTFILGFTKFTYIHTTITQIICATMHNTLYLDIYFPYNISRSREVSNFKMWILASKSWILRCPYLDFTFTLKYLNLNLHPSSFATFCWYRTHHCTIKYQSV